MTFVYPAIFHREEDQYWVEFPDLEGCHTFGDDILTTMESAQEALSVHLASILDDLKDGGLPPAPTDMMKISCDTESFVTLVSCDLDPYLDGKAVNKTVTLPTWMNNAAKTRNINFSQTLQKAILKELQN